MKEYELVHEIKNSCPNNQMRDIFFDEIECENPESWLRQKLAGRNAEFTIEAGNGGTVTIYALVDGMTEKYVFTPI